MIAKKDIERAVDIISETGGISHYCSPRGALNNPELTELLQKSEQESMKQIEAMSKISPKIDIDAESVDAIDISVPTSPETGTQG